MIGLVDANNFYVSCERVFNPALEGKPVGVMSRNEPVFLKNGLKSFQYFQLLKIFLSPSIRV